MIRRRAIYMANTRQNKKTGKFIHNVVRNEEAKENKML